MPRNVEALWGDAVNVEELFTTSDRRFRAPEFQRTYVWTAKGAQSEVSRLWSDLETLRDQGDSEESARDSLFLGALVLQLAETPGGKNVPLNSIIDGQQRMLTIYMILVALAEAYEAIGDIDSADDIEGEYLLVRSGTHKGTPRVEPTLTDSQQFRKIMGCLKHRKARFTTQVPDLESPNLPGAWAAIRDTVRKLSMSDGVLDPQKLSALRDDIVKRVEFVEINIGINHDPHQVYERLNTGGKPLKAIDLVRNAAFLIVGADADAAARFYSEHWGPFEEELGTTHQDMYFFPYALIRNPKTTTASTYRNLRDHWASAQVTGGERGEDAARRIIDDLREYLPAFRALVNTARPAKLSDSCWRKIEVLHRLGVPRTMYVYLMQLINDHLHGGTSEDELCRAIDVIDTFLSRRAVAGIAGTGLHTIFKDMWQRTRADEAMLMTRLQARTIQFPDDQEFERAIREEPIYASPRCRYILTEYERGLKGGDTSEWDPDAITVDHLMPQSSKDHGWGGVKKIDAERVVDTWANLVPLTRKANSEKGNRSWDETRAMMIEDPGYGSIFKSTNAVFHEYEEWNVEKIGQRADTLVSWAIERWPKLLP